ncbi:MAG: SWIM zinc finger family protein [Desulfovibrionaceae bacterium]|nr:SWIM zinc finger family protein [Desulfovibrionaceae bacterium]
MSYYWGWTPYVSVAQKKRQAASRLAKLKKEGHPAAPVTVTGMKIARSFWGMSWCENLERYSDYASRLPRGRSYVRNGCVIDLQIGKGQITAAVSGTGLYAVNIAIEPVARTRWKAICKDCAGAIDSLVELLQGRLDKGVMDRVCRQADGLFPSPKEIKLSCDCPDWAGMCKHVAAVLYGVGARLDHKPELLFLLRGVDEGELIAGAGETLAQSEAPLEMPNRLADGDMAALFGLDMAGSAAPARPAPAKKSPRPVKAAKAAAAFAADAGKTATKPARKTKAGKATASASPPAKTSKPRTAEKPRRAPAKAALKRQADAQQPPAKTASRKKAQGSRAPRSK